MTKYSASIEWLCAHAGIVRVHEGLNGQFGDPYVWTCTIQRGGSMATIKGVMAPLPRGAARPFGELLYRHGLRTRIHTRKGSDPTGDRSILRPIRPPRPTTSGDVA